MSDAEPRPVGERRTLGRTGASRVGADLAHPRRRRRQPEPRGRQRRAARHRQGVRLLADRARPHRGRLLARSGRVRALPRRARRPLRAQADADPRRARCRSRPACSPPAAPSDAVLIVARLARRHLGRHGLPHDARADHRAVVGAARAPDRSRSGRRSAARSPRSARSSPARCSSTSGGARSSSSRCRWPSSRSCWRSRFVPAHVNETDRPGRQPRRHPVRRCSSARSSSPSTSRRCPNKGRLAIGLGVIAVAAAVAFVIRQRRVAQPAVRPRTSPAVASSGSPRAPGSSCSARSWARCSSASSTSRTCSATTPSTPAPRSCRPRCSWCIVAPRSAKLVEARGARGSRCSLGYVFCFLGFLTMLLLWKDGQPVLAGRRSATRSSALGVGFAGTPASHSLTGSVPGRSAPGWRRAPPTSSATSAARSCSRSSVRC